MKFGYRPCVILFALWQCIAVAGAETGPPTTETLRVAVHLGALRDVSRTDVEISLKVWAEELMKVLEVSADIRFFQTLPEMQRELEAGRVNFVIADGVSLLRYFDPDELADGFGNGARGESSLVLVTRKNTGIHEFKDLAGKKVALLSDNEISDLWLDTACLRVFHKSCAQASVSVSKESKSLLEVLKLFFGKADAALVRGRAFELAGELNPQILSRLEVIERIPLYPSALGLFSNRVSPKFRDYVIRKVPQLQIHPRGRQILEVLQTEHIDRVPKLLLEPIRQLMREHETLSARYALKRVGR